MNKIMSILFLQLSIVSNNYAQSGLFINPQVGTYHTTFHNKEDKQAGDLLKQKGQLTVGYGVDIGYMFTKRIGVSLGVHRQSYHAKYSGYDKDSVSVISFNASHKMHYIQVPLKINMMMPIKNRLYGMFNVGISYQMLLNYMEEGESIAKVLNSANTLTGSNGKTDKSGSNSEFYYLSNPNDINYIRSKTEDPWYKGSSLSLIGHLGVGYALSDRLQVSIMFSYMLGITDIENKVLTKVTYTSSKTGYHEGQEYLWHNTNKYKYYYRFPSEYGTRPATYTQAIGGGISLSYFLKGGLLPSIHTGKH